MPWQLNGTFERVNGPDPIFSGSTVWQQDQTASIKIIALRHDTHDEDIATGIAACLNLDGLNAMRATLDMNGNIITGVADGSATTEAINFGQFISVSDQVDTNTAQIDINTSAIAQNVEDINNINAVNSDDLITGQSFDGTDFVSTRVSGPFTTPLEDFVKAVVTTFKSKGAIRHLSADAGVSIDTSTGNRYTLTASVSQDLNIILPTGDDPDIGSEYEVEGTVLIDNTGISTITLKESGVNVPANQIKGIQPTASGVNYLLTYIIHRQSGDNYKTLYIWSA
jgi:hypothetical protein